jgi:hypothetical protein
MNDEAFYEFRTKVRKKLGRTIFYPEDIERFSDEIIKVFLEDELMTKVYLRNCTDNEIKALDRVLRHINETNKNPYIAEMLETNIVRK